MRIAVAVTAIALTAGGGTARAQAVDDVHAETGVTVFADSDETTIWTPRADVGATLPGSLELDVSWSADVISSASVDVVTAATPAITETRHQVGPRLRRENLLPDLDVNLGYVYSFERDTSSHTVDVGVRRGLADDVYELGVTYGLSYNLIGIRDQPVTDRLPLWVHSAELSGSRIIDRNTVVQLGYALFWADGYQANPYRMVPIGGDDSLVGAMWVPERVPDTRLRHAPSARVQRLVAGRLFTSAGYRLYFDDWGVVSHTVDASIGANVAGQLTLVGRARGTYQGAASFYERRYDMELEYVTRDRRLSQHESGVLGAAAIWTVRSFAGVDTIVIALHVDAVAWRYGDFDRPALTITSGAELVPMGTVVGAVTMASVEVRP